MKKFRELERLLLACGLLALALGLAGCGSDDTTNPATSNATANEDVAEVLSASVGQENGGATEQINDLLALARGGRVDTSPGLGKAGVVHPTYDTLTRTWTLHFSRERTSQSGNFYAFVERTYQWQFLRSDGEPQFGYVVGNDTAYSIDFTIVDGAGRHRTPRKSHTLTDLSGHWLATGTNSNIVTINGNYSRAATDTLWTRNATRAIDYATTLTLTDIVIQRLAAGEAWENVSGTISGTFTGFVTFTKGEEYSERTINREFTITLDGGQARIRLGGLNFFCDLRTGELNSGH